MNRARLVVAVVGAAACGRVHFGYPLVPCDEVVGAEGLLGDNDHCYTRHDLTVQYNIAAQTCFALGGYPATITSDEENATVASLGLTGPTRIGLITGAPGSDVWHWETEEPTPYASWAAGEPAICPGTTSAALISPAGTWSSVCYSEGHPFTCEIEPWLIRDDGHGYRVSWERMGWLSSQVRCEEMGGHLATISSDDERTFVAPLLDQPMWIGASSADGLAFSWVTGEPFDVTAWAASEPDDGVASCVVTDDQTWTDVTCAANVRALCERE